MRLPADPATDVPRLARVTSGASLTSASGPDAALQRGSYGRSLSARPSAAPHASSVENLQSFASTRAVSEPVAGRTLRSALEQMRQQAAPAPAKTAIDVVGVSNPQGSLPAVSGSSTPLVRDSGQERDSGGTSQRQSLDGYVLQVRRAGRSGSILALESGLGSSRATEQEDLRDTPLRTVPLRYHEQDGQQRLQVCVC